MRAAFKKAALKIFSGRLWVPKIFLTADTIIKCHLFTPVKIKNSRHTLASFWKGKHYSWKLLIVDFSGETPIVVKSQEARHVCIFLPVCAYNIISGLFLLFTLWRFNNTSLTFGILTKFFNHAWPLMTLVQFHLSGPLKSVTMQKCTAREDYWNQPFNVKILSFMQHAFHIMPISILAWGLMDKKVIFFIRICPLPRR